MSRINIFIDFGSTYTKMAAFDLDNEELLARIQVPSTVDVDITAGLEDAFTELSKEIKIGAEDRRRAIACSSAAGGLRVVCVGLVKEYTTEAGRLAALGAGAKIVGEFSYDLSAGELDEIEEMDPDIVLLTGGTDGGNKKVIVRNASLLARAGENIRNIIVAGNKSAYDDIHAIFGDSKKNVIFTKNVMPEIGTLNVGPTNCVIRELFINRITEAKGITKAKKIIGDVIMPTPSAVLEAAKLLAEGTTKCPGLGELLVVDVGGATTDVYSVAMGFSSKKAVHIVGLPEPYIKRTVEGDLGLYHNLVNLQELAQAESVPEHFEEIVEDLRRNREIMYDDTRVEVHLLLSRLAVDTAVTRHVGRIEMIVTPGGDMPVQRGKDLTAVKNVIGSGGAISFSPQPKDVLEGALFRDTEQHILKPIAPQLVLDERNILFSVGLLAGTDSVKALSIGRKYLRYL
ncbi:MAG: methylaspartate mutase accessory protein GlmL [Bacillota bacterium]|nr:methylaspartate mutase accessory protein GlmL [Bacillota bacterium]